MARIGLFGRRTEEQSAPTAVGTAHVVDRDRATDAPDRAREERDERLVDRDGDTAVYAGRTADGRKLDADRNRDGVVDDDEARTARAAHERTQARLANRERLAAKERVDTRTEARERAGTTAVVDRDRDGVDDRVQTRPAPAAEPRFRARASMLATLALLVGLTSVYAALTGRLAPAAVVLGVLGLVLSFGGMTATGRPKVAGGGLAALALLLSVGGAVLGVLAMNHVASWLDSDVDQVARWRDWLDATLPFVRGW